MGLAATCVSAVCMDGMDGVCVVVVASVERVVREVTVVRAAVAELGERVGQAVAPWEEAHRRGDHPRQVSPRNAY